MRLKPPPSTEEALKLLTVNAVLNFGAADAKAMESHLGLIADAMAAVAAIEVGMAVEPLFAEDIALDPEIAA